jgi:hypothetical protein
MMEKVESITRKKSNSKMKQIQILQVESANSKIKKQ